MKLLLLLFAFLAPLQLVGFEWEAPTTNVDGTPLTDLSHYTLKVDEFRLTVPKEQTTGAVMLDRAVEHRAHVTASDLAGNESEPSNEVVVAQLVDPTPTPVPSCDQCCFLQLDKCRADKAGAEDQVATLQTEKAVLQAEVAALKAAATSCEAVKACVKTKYPLTYSRCAQ